MAWTIEIAQLPLAIPFANGIASHAFWVLKNNDVVVAELQGLATGGNGFINAMGGPFNTTDTIGMYNVTSETLSTPEFRVFSGQFMSTWSGVTSNTIWSGTQADAIARWDVSVSIARVVNALNIDYAPLVINGFNSNSVAEMVGDLLGFPDVRPPAKADGSDPWATGWNKNLATKVIDGILHSIEAKEDALGRPLSADELKPYLDLLERMQPAEDYCFPAGTLIALTPTEACTIEALRPGDLVLAFDPSADLGRGALVPKRVVRLFQNETEEWLRLTWQAEGEAKELTVTPGHRLLDSHGHFRRIDEIVQDEIPKIVLENGGLAAVSAERIVWSEDTRHLFEEVEAVAMASGDGLTHRTQGAWRSHNFEVEDLHTYVAGGVRVHNDSQATIDLAGNIGRTFGTMLAGVLLEDENQFTQVLGGTVLGLITENLSEVIADTGFHLFDGTQLDFGSSVETAMRQLKDVDAELLAGLSSAASSLFLAELGEELGLEGFGAQLFNTVGSTYLGSVSDQVIDNLVVSIRRRPQVGHRSRSRSISMSSCRFSIPNGVNAMTPSSLGP